MRHTMADQVTDTLRRMILTRELAPGRRITQVELADMLNVSTTPIREALLRLAAEGFVEAMTNRSFSVTDTTRARLNDIYWIHGVLIAEMTARAWDHRDDELITIFKVAHSDFITGLRRNSSEAMNAANLRVYAAIEDWSQSPGLAFMLGITLRFFPDFSNDVPGWSQIGSRWHTGLIDEFTEGTREGAAEATLSSLRAATDLIVDSFWVFDRPDVS
jgi:DNA-binding GntR family transcriptional regulator